MRKWARGGHRSSSRVTCRTDVYCPPERVPRSAPTPAPMALSPLRPRLSQRDSGRREGHGAGRVDLTGRFILQGSSTATSGRDVPRTIPQCGQADVPSERRWLVVAMSRSRTGSLSKRSTTQTRVRREERAEQSLCVRINSQKARSTAFQTGRRAEGLWIVRTQPACRREDGGGKACSPERKGSPGRVKDSND